MQIKAFRRERGLSLRQLGELVGVTAASISRIENGQQDPSSDLLRRLHEVSGGLVTPNDILLGSAEEKT